MILKTASSREWTRLSQTRLTPSFLIQSLSLPRPKSAWPRAAASISKYYETGPQRRSIMTCYQLQLLMYVYVYIMLPPYLPQPIHVISL